ncbi:hypothetical protein BT96DRAFT_1026186, partial [Gymnopus androsaceus JB14]
MSDLVIPPTHDVSELKKLENKIIRQGKNEDPRVSHDLKDLAKLEKVSSKAAKALDKSQHALEKTKSVRPCAIPDPTPATPASESALLSSTGAVAAEGTDEDGSQPQKNLRELQFATLNSGWLLDLSDSDSDWKPLKHPPQDLRMKQKPSSPNAPLDPQTSLKLMINTWTQALMPLTGKETEESFESIKEPLAKAIPLMKSDLLAHVERICHPNFLLRHPNVHNSTVDRIYHVGESLALITSEWVPKEVKDAWPLDQQHGRFIPKLNPNGLPLQNATHFFNAFDRFPELIPGDDHYGKIFFLLTLESFIYYYHQWLGPWLEGRGYNLHPLHKPKALTDLYSLVVSQLKRWCTDVNADGRCVIEARALLELEPYENAPGVLISPSINVVSNIATNLTLVMASLLKKLNDKQLPSKPVYRPESYGNMYKYSMDPIDCDNKVLEHCDHQLLLMVDGEENQCDPEENVVDFPFFNHGIQFDYWNRGIMKPGGSRVPSGGREADTYAGYTGITSATVKGINLLFDQADVSNALLFTAKLAHKPLFEELLRNSSNCDRVGMTGANVYNCTGYVAPAHGDNNLITSLSAQALLKAQQEYSEFAFCQLEYRYYIHSHTNLLWSFFANRLHCTMLPSSNTLGN